MVMTAEAAKTSNGSKVDWRTVRGLMVDAIYGGRVDNPHDMRVLATYLRRYFNSDVVSAPVAPTRSATIGGSKKIILRKVVCSRLVFPRNLCACWPNLCPLLYSL